MQSFPFSESTDSSLSADPLTGQNLDGPVVSEDSLQDSLLTNASLSAGISEAPNASTAVANNPLLLTHRVSVDSDGNQSNNFSRTPSISADGRYVAFESNANKLVADDTNGVSDIFIYDTQTGNIRRISAESNGDPSNAHSSNPSLSADGRYVVFQSDSSTLVADDTNIDSDIFVYDTQTNNIRRVSVDSNGNQANSNSYHPSISADGRYVAFASNASNLVAGDTNDTTDVFIYDTQTSNIRRVSLSSSGDQSDRSSFNPSLSADGRYVAFQSYANNLVAGDTNNRNDIFVYDTQTSTIRRVSVSSNGDQSDRSSFNPSISADGRYIAFESDANNLVAGDTNGVSDVFVYDTQTNNIRRVSVNANGDQSNSDSFGASISADGRYVAFESDASNLVVGDTNDTTDIFVYDLQTGNIRRVSVDSNGEQSNDYSSSISLSADGNYVAFESRATNLVEGDTNNVPDIFVSATLPTVSVSSSAVSEGNNGLATATFTATLSHASSDYTTVSYETMDGTATSGTDYVASQGNLVFRPGETTISFSVPILGDTQVEENETFSVNLFNPVNATLATSQATATIFNDDVAYLSINNVTQVEGNNGITNFDFTVSLNAPSTQPISVTYFTEPTRGTAIAGSDYASTNGNLTFNPGETSKTVSVRVVGDTLTEANETFFVNLTNPTNATIAVSRGTGTILNDDLAPAEFSLVSVSDGVLNLEPGNTIFETPIEFNPIFNPLAANAIALSALPEAIAVNSTEDTVNPNDGVTTLREAINTANANPGADLITFDSNVFAGSQTIQLTSQLFITDSLIIQGTGVNNLTISGDANNNGINDDGDVRLFFVNQGTVRFNDLTLANGRAKGGNGGNGGGGGGAGMGGAMFINSGTVTTSNVTFRNNQAIGGSGGSGIPGFGGNFGGNGGNGGGGGGAGLGGAIFIRSGSLTLANSSFLNNMATGGLGGIAPSPSNSISGANGQGKAGAIFAVTPELASAAGVAVAPTVVIDNLTNFSNSAADDAGISTDNDNVFGTTLPRSTFSFTSAAYGALEGNSGIINKAIATVQRTGDLTGVASVQVALDQGSTAISNSDYTNFLPITVKFANGEASKTVELPIVSDTLFEADDTINLKLVNPSGSISLGSQQTATYTIFNDDVLTLSIDDVSRLEGNNGTSNFDFTVSLSAPSPQPVSVTYVTANGTAIAGSDYAFTNGNLTFKPGETSKTISVAVVGNTLPEADETFFVNLLAPTKATIVKSQGVGTIGNDDTTVVAIADNFTTQTNTPPVANPDFATVTEGSMVVIPVLANDVDADGDSLRVVDFGYTSYGPIFQNSDGTFIYTAYPDFSGTDAFTYKIYDGKDGISTDATVTITINPLNLEGTTGADSLQGTETNNTINGRAGNDWIEGNGGNDILNGNAGNDTLNGGNGNDTLKGGSENDYLIGAQGDDSLNGGSQDDILFGGEGRDTLIGGTGSDRYVYTSLSEAGDIITDFTNGSDVLDLVGILRSLNYSGSDPIGDGFLTLVPSGGNTRVQIDPDGALGSAQFSTLVTLNGMLPANFEIGHNLLV